MRTMPHVRRVMAWKAALGAATILSACGSAASDRTPAGASGGGTPAAIGGSAGVPGGGASSSGGRTGTGGGGDASSGAAGAAAGPGSGGSFGSGGAAGQGLASGGGGAGTAGAGAGGAGGGAGGAGMQAGGVSGAAGQPAAGGAGGAAPAFDRAAVAAIMRRVADYAIGQFGSTNSNGWVRATFHTGLLAAYRALGDTKYHDYTRQWGQANAWLVSTDNSSGPRFADNQACLQSYAELYLENPGPANAVLIASARTVFDSMVAAPKAGRIEWSWCDALYMAPPALARMAQAAAKPEYLTLMHAMFWDTKAFLFDPVQNLFWRDGTFRNTNTYWARGNGWVVGSIARILDDLPTGDPRQRDYQDLLRLMANKLRTIQASDGFWRSSLMDPAAFTTPESSGTAFFCFAMAWGINHGVLDRATFLPTVTKAWAALVSAVNAQGRLGWVQAVGSKPGPSTVDSTNDYAVGAFLLAGSELLRL